MRLPVNPLSRNDFGSDGSQVQRSVHYSVQYTNDENAIVVLGVEDSVRLVLEAAQSRSEAVCTASDPRILRQIAKHESSSSR